MTRRKVAAFTLVELLVVIGIIAVLISLLLPSLNKARQQANLIVCESNLRTIGQLVGIYEANNRGYLPYGDAAVNYGQPSGQEWAWPDVLTLSGQPTQYASGAAYAAANGYGGTPQGNQAADFAAVFHDVDVPDFGWGVRAASYNANPRLLPYAFPGQTWTYDGITNQTQPFKQRPFSSVLNASQKIMIWDGSIWVQGGIITGTGNFVDIQFDGAAAQQVKNGACFQENSPYMPAASYANSVCAGNGGTYASSEYGGVTKAIQATQNKDTFNGYYNPFALRFRHNNNSMANALFVDGHVESRGFLDIKEIEVCVNSF